jgi:hypothetical protein
VLLNRAKILSTWAGASGGGDGLSDRERPSNEQSGNYATV